MAVVTADTVKALPPHLDQALRRMGEINSLPEITARIVQVVENPLATAHDMHRIVHSDPALAAKILKVVNSAFYGRPAQIASLERAILMLGLSAVKNIALAASLSRLFRASAVSEQFAARDLWRHSVATAVCARALAKLGGAVEPDEAFVAGLMHDLGLIVEQQLFAPQLRRVAEQCYNTPQDFCAAERTVIGADHEAFGGALASLWHFPPALRHAIGYHHTPELLTAELAKIVGVVYVADTLCSRTRLGLWLTSQTQEISEAQLKAVGLVPDKLIGVMDDLVNPIEEADRVFLE